MNKTHEARTHRKGDLGAVKIGDSPTKYLSAITLRRLAKDLAALADDILCNVEQDSNYGTRTVNGDPTP